ncbi:hypothetical protein PPSIR1_24124 [Plesiocystis pacifica SIR-1]|uniref:Uncharacterized protein n=1 Tax=Plesiocystis pacifica SIR-1 TaxID=391625 RepID=A6GJT0_9BACT|nr:hypothetical protein [Plesiocystis pacifica]EDM73883.1 hypothetical protein PPSIR1_24124 [Plesiocystis pacifica SIR-1]
MRPAPSRLFSLLVLSTAPVLACAPDSIKEPAKAEQPAESEPEQPTQKVEAPVKEEAEQPPPGVKAPGNLPVMTEEELAAEEAKREACVRSCVDERQREAKGADAIELECRESCEQELPIRQVEVVPKGPIEDPG